MSTPDQITGLVAARADPSLVVIEGFHPLKHALRFGAEIRLAVTHDRPAVLALARALAPDIVDRLERALQVVDEHRFRSIAPPRLATPVLAVAARPSLEVPSHGVIVLLEAPTNLGNLGAVIRVAAGLRAAAVLVTGSADPWQPAAVRGSAGLHFALPVGRALSPPPGRPLLLLDPQGEPLAPGMIGADSVLAFGTERAGLSPELRRLPHRRLAIPTRPGVSSLNLATAVAITLWTWRLGLPSGGGAG